MNQTDYKKIAEIIRQRIKYSLEKKESIFHLSVLVKDLADYFEEEVNLSISKAINTTELLCKRIMNDKDRKFIIETQGLDKKFNRKEFLKDCGVKE